MRDHNHRGRVGTLAIRENTSHPGGTWGRGLSAFAATAIRQADGLTFGTDGLSIPAKGEGDHAGS